jgi:hypothetical protein
VINLRINPLNVIESSLGDLCGSTHPVKSVAYKIRSGLSNQGFAVVKTAEVDRLHSLLTTIVSERLSESYAFDSDIQEAFSIVEGWK